jgi:hypothetical protein
VGPIVAGVIKSGTNRNRNEKTGSMMIESGGTEVEATGVWESHFSGQVDSPGFVPVWSYSPELSTAHCSYHCTWSDGQLIVAAVGGLTD